MCRACLLPENKKDGRKFIIILDCIKENDESDFGNEGSERLEVLMCSIICQGLETIHT